MYVLTTFRNLVGVKLGSDAVVLSLFLKKFHVRIECNGNELEHHCFHLQNIKGVSSCIIKMFSDFINKFFFKNSW